MAARFWVGGTGNWDAATTTNWSASSGGAGGASVPGASDDVTFDASSGGGTVTVTATQSVLSITGGAHTGTLNTNGQTITAGTFNYSGAGTRTLTLGASTVNITGTGVVLQFTTDTNLTFNPNTSTIVMSGAAAQFVPGTVAGTSTFNNLSFTGSGIASTNRALTCANFTRTGTAAKSDTYNLVGDLTVTGTFTATGNSAVNRMLVASNTVGTTRTITAAVVSLTNVGFTDITGAGAAAPFTGTSVGDAAGNSGITFTTAVTRYWVGGGGSWDDTARWSATSGGASGASVPLPQDTVNIDANSGLSSTNIVSSAAMPRLCKDINWTGTPSGVLFNVPTTGCTFYGSWTGVADMSQSAGQNIITFAGRGSHTLTSAGITFTSGITFAGLTGTYTLQDALTSSAAITVSVNLVTQGFTVTCTVLSGVGAITITSGTSTFNLTSTAATNVLLMTSSAVFATPPEEVVITTASTNARTIAMSGRAIKTLTYTVANSPGTLTFLAGTSMTITNLNVNAGKIVMMPSGVTQTISGNFNVNGAVNGYLYLPGVAGNYASAPDSAALDITGDIDLRAAVNMDDWTPSASVAPLIHKDNATTRSYGLSVLSSGALRFLWSVDGSATLNHASDALGQTDGTLLIVRVTMDVDDGAGNRVTKFFKKSTTEATANADMLLNTGWTQVGSTITTAGTTSIFSSDQPLALGMFSSGASAGSLWSGKYYAASVHNGIDGTPVFNANFTTKTVGANSFTESSANAATVSINRGFGRVGDGRVSLVSTTGGSPATLTSTNQQSVNYLSIQDSTVDATPKWYAGTTSTNVSGNTNWLFVNAPGGGNFLLMGIG